MVPHAGIFTAKIKQKNPHGDLLNLVVLFSSETAVNVFYQRYKEAEYHDFWAEGYLLPSRASVCYSVLYVVKFRFNGEDLVF